VEEERSMENLKFLEGYRGKLIRVLFTESGKDFFIKGILLDVAPDRITLETKSNLMFISADQVKKVKIPLNEADNHD
jgi:hypothetical protein